MSILQPYRLAVKRQTIKLFIEKHKYSRAQARATWSHVTDKIIEQANGEVGIMAGAFDPSSIFQWIKDNWKTILKVAMSVVGILLMFIQPPPTATGIPPQVVMYWSKQQTSAAKPPDSVRTEPVDGEGEG